MVAILPAAAIGAAVGAELPRFFNDALDQFGSGEGVYLRDGMPEGIVATVGQAVGRAYCRAYAGVSTEYPPGRGERIEAACRPYLDSIGSTGGPGLEPPFQGGQCDGQRYGCRVRGRRTTGFDDEFLVTVAGPVGGVRLVPSGATGQQIQILCRAFGGGTLCGSVFNFTPAPTWRAVASAGSQVYTSASLFSIQPCGFTDNCGNPAPIVIQPPVAPVVPAPPFRFNPRPGIDVEIDLELFPDGTVIFDIGTGPITVDPFIDPTGGGGGGDGGGSGGDGPPGDVGTPGTAQPTGTDGEAEGEAPPGSVLTGLRVDILLIPEGAKQYAPGVYRGVCYVYMGTPAGLDHDPAGAMVKSGQFVFAEKDNLTKWSVSANDGYNLLITPYYREVEP